MANKTAAPDMTGILRVCKVTLLTYDQAKQLTIAQRTLDPAFKDFGGWWLRTPDKPGKIYVVGDWRGDIYPRPVDGQNADGHFSSEDFQPSIRPAILITNLEDVKTTLRKKFMYRGLRWHLCSFSEDGYAVALCDVPVRGKDGQPIKVMFGNPVTDPEGNVLNIEDLNKYDCSTVKEVLEKWAEDNEIINDKPKKLPDLTHTAKVVGVTLLTMEQAEQIPLKERRRTDHGVSEYWLRSRGYDIFEASYVDSEGLIFNWGMKASCSLGVRPAILISNLELLHLGPRRKFMYKGLRWQICPFTENGYAVAFCAELLNDENGPVKMPFKSDIYDWDSIDPMTSEHITWGKVSTYETSTIKPFLEKWAADNGIINCPTDS